MGTTQEISDGRRLGMMCENFLKNISGKRQNGDGGSLHARVQPGTNPVERGSKCWMRKRADGYVGRLQRTDLVAPLVNADDQLVIIHGVSAREIEEKWKIAWDKCKSWQDESNTKYNVIKSSLQESIAEN